jgi:hypothetical protein
MNPLQRRDSHRNFWRNERENLYICGECGATVDKRQLNDVIYHIDHKRPSQKPRAFREKMN